MIKGVSYKAACGAVGPGWKKLIKLFYSTVRSSPISIYVTQVKEKYGSLRIYFDVTKYPEDYCVTKFSNDINHGKTCFDIYAFVDAISLLSEHTCENCGKYGVIQRGKMGWFSCLCDSCYLTENK